MIQICYCFNICNCFIQLAECRFNMLCREVDKDYFQEFIMVVRISGDFILTLYVKWHVEIFFWINSMLGDFKDQIW